MGLADATFTYNPGFGSYIVSSPRMATFVGEIVEMIAELAGDSAPFRLGHLSGSVESEVTREGAAIVGKVTVSDFKWRWHEFGTWKMGATPFLRPALTAVVPNARIRGG